MRWAEDGKRSMVPLAVVLVLLGLVVPLTLNGYHPRDANSASAVERAPVANGADVAPLPTPEPNRAPADPVPDPPWALPPHDTSTCPQPVPASTAGDTASGRMAEALSVIHPSRGPPAGSLS